MLVKVIKRQVKTITTEEVFYIESSSIDEAKFVVSSNSYLDGHLYTKEDAKEDLIYGLEANFEGYAKIALKHSNGNYIIYSPSLEIRDIETAMLEQVACFTGAYIRDLTSVQVDYTTERSSGYRTYFIEILEQPTITKQDLKIQRMGELVAAISAKSKDADREREKENPELYDEKYFQFIDWLDKNG